MKKSQLMEIKKNGNTLVKKVINVILDHGDTEGMEAFMKDVLSHGCQSGIVGELIYYTDTTAFYKKYKKEIQSLLKDLMSDTGCKSPSELFKAWDDEDTFAEDTQNQNLLAWFAFEETCRMISDRLELGY